MDVECKGMMLERVWEEDEISTKDKYFYSMLYILLGVTMTVGVINIVWEELEDICFSIIIVIWLIVIALMIYIVVWMSDD